VRVSVLAEPSNCAMELCLALSGMVLHGDRESGRYVITQLSSTFYWAETFEIAEVTPRRACFGAAARALDEEETGMPIDDAWRKGSKIDLNAWPNGSNSEKSDQNDLERGYNMSCQEHNLATTWNRRPCCRKWFVRSGRQLAHETPLLNDWRNSSRSSRSIIRMWAVSCTRRI
jgi:hypothetical protein